MSIIDEIDNQVNSATAEKKKKRRKPHERKADRAKISEMYLSGKSQYAIAQVLNLSQSQISTELKIVEDEWVQNTSMNIDVVKAKELLRIDKIEQEMWACWEKSKRNKVNKITRGKINSNPSGGKTPNPTSFEMYEEEELGDTKYMDKIQWCVEQRLKIFGGYAPKKIAETDPTGTKEAGQTSREEILSWIDNITSKVAAEQPKQLSAGIEEEKNYVDAEEIPEKEQITETYKLLGETKGLLCFLCEKITWSLVDFQNRFCPSCNTYHENDEELEKVEENEEGEVDPSKLNLFNPAELGEFTPEINSSGNSQEEVPYNKRHDQILYKKMGDAARMTNYGFESVGVKIR